MKFDDNLDLGTSIILPRFQVDSGYLLPFEFNELTNWIPKRSFLLVDKKGSLRGKHAHRNCKQAFWLLSGSIKISLSNKNKKIIKKIETPENILCVPEKTWVELEFLEESYVMVFASEPYDAYDYIYDVKELE